MRQPLCAVVDIGSTTVHLLIARLSEEGRLLPYHEDSVRPLLGARRAPDGAIPAEAEADVLTALRCYQDVARQLGAARLLVVATEAVRSARNGAALLQRWQDALDLPIITLTASQETRLAMLGAYNGVLPEAGLFADSGGASTQVAVVAGRALLWQRSLPIGASSLTGAHLAGDPPSVDEREAADEAVRAALTTLPSPPSRDGLQPVITGGSAVTLQSLALDGCPPGTLSTTCLAQAEALLTQQSSQAIARRFNLPVERARILGAGCLIVRSLVLWSDYDAWRVSVAGIREGMIRAWTANPQAWLPAVVGQNVDEVGVPPRPPETRPGGA